MFAYAMMSRGRTRKDKVSFQGTSSVSRVPFKPREPQPGLEAAMDRLAAIDAEMKQVEERRRELREERAGAIKDALQQGATLSGIAEVFGVSAVRVRQMRDGG